MYPSVRFLTGLGDAGKIVVPASAPVRRGAEKQARSRATRGELVTAARLIFARDGFEMARLEDIAAAAGKTRGAFYAHFHDKEDVFFAIFEQDMARDHKAISKKLSALPSSEQRLDALSQYLLALFKNKRRMLLSLEFKLYAIRKPHGQKRLANLHAAMCVRCAETHIDHLLPELSHADPQRKRRQAAIFGAVLDGLVLNRLFDPSALQSEQMLALIRAGVRIAIAQARTL